MEMIGDDAVDEDREIECETHCGIGIRRRTAIASREPLERDRGTKIERKSKREYNT